MTGLLLLQRGDSEIGLPARSANTLQSISKAARRDMASWRSARNWQRRGVVRGAAAIDAFARNARWHL